ncbi:hypothetical protein RHSIM_Rhsim05G0046300 [Rhododendron simsii]|uniref:Uncharacterized protein n=1 Tax=Rhododendron simsii TaxID=118357 RepID=A0A834GVN5_RHOSS|nr:hypothetical protein RHSIM_RhsimUnG0140800 [Rhododendron simsii]KAF7142708.1 hypothetical protein RHSIM_Rhsim05G0046300 [Rhododendron simsii]
MGKSTHPYKQLRVDYQADQSSVSRLNSIPNYLQNLSSRLRHKGLLGSSSAIRSRVSVCGVGTSLCKPTPLQPWMPMTQHFQTTLPDFAPLTRRPALRPGVPFVTCNTRTLFSLLGNSPSRQFLRTSRRFPPQKKICQLAIKGKEVDRVLTKQASASVVGSLVCLSFLQDCETPMVFSGYVVRSDGIVATSTNCLRHLKGTEYKIGVTILGLTKAYKGVLLHANFLSKIAFVKILRCRQLRKPNCGKLDSLRKGADVVAMGCYPVCGSNWMNAKKGYSCKTTPAALTDLNEI